MTAKKDDFRQFEFDPAPEGRIHKSFLASDQPRRDQRRALLVYLHGRGERVEAEEKRKGRSSLRNNECLIPNVLENDGDTATFVKKRFIVVVPHGFLNGTEGWDCAGLWPCLKTFYEADVGTALSGEIYITGVSRGGTGTWRLASEVVSDTASPFCLKAIAAVDVDKPIRDFDLTEERLRDVRALGMLTSHLGHNATQAALRAVDQGDCFIDQSKRAEFWEAWGSLYGSREFYEWLLAANAPIPAVDFSILARRAAAE